MRNELWGEGRYFLIPSFFRLLIFLKKSKREFSIVFRTFGLDLKSVVYEFNKFASGEHPCYSGKGGTPLVKFDGSKGVKDLRIQDRHQKALFFRPSTDLKLQKMVTGTLNRTHEDDIETAYDGEIEEGNVALYKDAVEQYV